MSRNISTLAILFCIAFGNVLSMNIVYEWKDLEYKFPTEADRVAAVNNGSLVQGNGVPIDVDVLYNKDGSARTFVTIPRFTTGIPFSLATVTNSQGANGPQIQAFPNYEWHSSHGGNCDGITSVFRVAIDDCNRMWVIDTGRIDAVQHCPPQILVFDIYTDQLVKRFKIPEGQYTPGLSLFITPIVDVRDPPPGKCRRVMLYIADVQMPGLVVYDSAQDKSWRIQNKLMYPNPQYGTFTIAGESFDLMDGMFGLALTPKGRPGPRQLYFHALASDTENSVPLSLIDDSTIWTDDPEASPRAFKTLGKRGVQCAAEAMDRRGNLYCGSMEPISIFAWNIDTPYNKRLFTVVAENRNTLQFASAMKVRRNSLGQEELWTSTCRFQKVMAGTINHNEVNFRIQACNVNELLKGGCTSNRPTRPGYGRPGSSFNNNNLNTNLIFS